MIKTAIKHLERQNEASVFYFHPWEFDPDHPMPDCVTARERLSHYGFLKGNREKFIQLLKTFEMDSLGALIKAKKDQNAIL